MSMLEDTVERKPGIFVASNRWARKYKRRVDALRGSPSKLIVLLVALLAVVSVPKCVCRSQRTPSVLRSLSSCLTRQSMCLTHILWRVSDVLGVQWNKRRGVIE